MAPTNNEDASQYEFFSLLTEVITKDNTYESNEIEIKDLKTASLEYLTQIIYTVNKEPNLEYRINEIEEHEGSSSYSNKLQSNPVMSNILNLIALTSGLSINYVVSSILKENGNNELRNKFDEVHGIGSYNVLLNNLRPLLSLKEEEISSSEKAASTSSDLFNTDYNQIIHSLNEYELECIYKIETMLINSFFDKFKDNTNYINENLERLQNSLTSQKSKDLLRDLHKERVKEKIKVREKYKQPNIEGFMSLKMIIGVCIFILIVILFTLVFLKYM